MRRDQLEHAIRTACQIIGHDAVLVVGSQSILGSFADDELPTEATMSVEIDILPIGDDSDETARLHIEPFAAVPAQDRTALTDEAERLLSYLASDASSHQVTWAA